MKIELPYPPSGLNPNARLLPVRKRVLQRSYKETCYYQAVHSIGRSEVKFLPGKIAVTMNVYYPNRARRDDDNIESAFKVGRDGVALALKVDDHRFRVTRIIHDEIIKGGKIVLELKEQ